MPDVRYVQQTDIAIVGTAVELDWLMTPMHLLGDGFALQSAVIIALGTDALVPADAVLPDPDSTDRGGWWGDMDAEEIWNGWPVGSKLWLLRRAKITPSQAREGSTVYRAESYAREALRPFTDQRIASRIDAGASRTDRGRIDVSVVIYRGPDRPIDLRYASLWEELGAP
ncbi:phage GP46 family protein [Bradyrhizobium septentrionale]|uniref:Phage GP46 family protein n=1 Tax=Bradyrhizobium septentrionale TaxID=1404411 RepID=A0A974A1C3_9BRAD|nr:phage GP46 family protein [Bradyrhizobium septentrionale]UGY13733.1 phage GP46 family protein [Bradyrhizobium septentrionale]